MIYKSDNDKFYFIVSLNFPLILALKYVERVFTKEQKMSLPLVSKSNV